MRLGDFEGLLDACRRYEDYLAARCPFHSPDEHPSLLVYADGFFQCLACGVRGRHEYLYEVLRGHAPRHVAGETAHWNPPYLGLERAENEGIANSAHEALLNFDNLRWYLTMRGVEGRIEPCRLGWFQGWYTIPVYDRERSFRGMVLRAGSHIQRATGQRFHQPKSQRPLLFCPDWRLMDTKSTLFVVFGMLDALSLSELRFSVVTSTGGKDSFSPDWLADWRSKIVIVPDRGEEKDAIELAGHLDWRGSVLQLDYGEHAKDANDLLVADPANLRNQLLKYD